MSERKRERGERSEGESKRVGEREKVIKKIHACFFMTLLTLFTDKIQPLLSMFSHVQRYAGSYLFIVLYDK